MSTITVRDGTTIFYKDWGKGQPILFHHGWPLSCDDWDVQMMFFLEEGYRVIAHDRRGHGRSSQTDTGNDMEATLKVHPRLPHGMATTHPEVINADLLSFIKDSRAFAVAERRQHGTAA